MELTSAASSALCDEPTLLQQALSKGILDDAECHPVFDAATRIQKLSLGNNLQHHELPVCSCCDRHFGNDDDDGSQHGHGHLEA